MTLYFRFIVKYLLVLVQGRTYNMAIFLHSYFFHDEKVSKKSRQNNAFTRSAASQEFQQK